ncbi:hypothetical protein ESCO_000190 [Escovopsis weberi]|uniref:Uncharacterized protein n=1 Tax=Escovopsis weberi TaxID=150374 RepID=A0A0M8MXC2_ESCWE|nr:hypothetical protein ESCO_000190 [Escovopsis weberi]
MANAPTLDSPDSLASLLSSITFDDGATIDDGISLRAFSAVVRTARAKISAITTDLELVARTIRAGDPPGAQDTQGALELLRRVQGAVELMAVSIGAMNEALCRIEARLGAGGLHGHAG